MKLDFNLDKEFDQEISDLNVMGSIIILTI